MLDLAFVRENPEKVKKAVKDKGENTDLERILQLDQKRREILREVEKLRHHRRLTSKEIGQLLQKGKDARTKIEGVRKLGEKIESLERKLKGINEELSNLLLTIPNIPHPDVPIGPDDSFNLKVKEWGSLPNFSFTPRNHIELGEGLDILDFPRAAKISGRGFALFKGAGALLERALINFMLDLHTTKQGYTEILPPYLCNRQSMVSTGQLPKMEGDMYHLEEEDLFLDPTAEVPVTNLHSGEVLEEEALPLYYVAYTACFRKEAGSYGRETRGLTRIHQFDKVELVKFVKPEDSYRELDSLLKDAEEVLQLLKIPYRVMLLATGKLSFAATKCYDIEVWAPGSGVYLEVSSCSNFEDFQARRANIHYRPRGGGKTHFLHTLNGSGVALPRTVIALLENYQQEDGSILIPEVLRPYMHGLTMIERRR